MKTKDRILKEAKRLFNEQGFGNVTTASLADSLGIAEGNLWYHFNNKRALLEAITLDFIKSANERLELQPEIDDNVVEEYVSYLDTFARELSEYSFLYRDQADYGEHSAALLEELPKLFAGSQRQFRDFFKVMTRMGLLDWPENQLDDLAVNVTIILRYGLEYFRESGLAPANTADSVRQIFTQHLTVFEHRLQPAAAAKLRQAFSDFTETASAA